MIKNQFSCDIISLQTNWGGEYQNVSTFLKSTGIIYRVSVTPVPGTINFKILNFYFVWPLYGGASPWCGGMELDRGLK